MPNVQIDPDKFLEMITSALKAAIVSVKEEIEKPVESPPKAKRGRPRKIQVELNGTEIINKIKPELEKEVNEQVSNVVGETVDEILAFKPPPEAIDPSRRPKGAVAAKRVGWKPPGNADGSINVAAQSVVDKNRKQRFIDERSVPADNEEWKKRYASNELTQRKPPAKKMKFTCDRCRHDFECFPSELPQAFMREKDPMTGEEARPTIKCNDCAGRPL